MNDKLMSTKELAEYIGHLDARLKVKKRLHNITVNFSDLFVHPLLLPLKMKPVFYSTLCYSTFQYPPLSGPTHWILP